MSRPSTISRPAVKPAPAISAANYIDRASAIDLFTIKASQLALNRSSATRVHDVARRLIAAHQGSSAQLSLSGRRLNLLPGSTVDPPYRARLEALSASSNFDRDYVREMRLVHDEAVALHAGYARNGASPTLVPVAKALLPVMQQQQRLVSYL